MISNQNKSNFLDLISRPALSMRTEKHKANKKEDMSNENQQHFNMWGRANDTETISENPTLCLEPSPRSSCSCYLLLDCLCGPDDSLRKKKSKHISILKSQSLHVTMFWYF